MFVNLCQLCLSLKVLKDSFSPGVKINWKQTVKNLHLLLVKITSTVDVENLWFNCLVAIPK